MQSTTTTPIPEVPAKRISKIHRGDKLFTYDPETMTMGQWEIVERELFKARYYDEMAEHAKFLQDPKHAVKSWELILKKGTDGKYIDDDNYKEYQSLFVTYEDDDQSKEATRAREYWKRRNLRASNYSRILRVIHQNLLVNESINVMISALLTPAGIVFSKQTQQQILEEVVPTITRKEAEDVLSNFFNSPELLESLSLNYFRDYQPHTATPDVQSTV